jgi:hypothetical protein
VEPKRISVRERDGLVAYWRGLREQLSDVVQNPDSATAEYGIKYAMLNGHVVVVPLVHLTDEQDVQVRELVLARDVRFAAHYAVCRLLDPDGPFASKLCQCRLESCGKFFFEQRPESGGRPRRYYCCAEHMAEAHDRDAPTRVARSRAARKPRRAK